MPSNEGHLHWDGSAASTVNYLGQELQLTAEVSNAATVKADPVGTIRIRVDGSGQTGVALPSGGWVAVPGTAPSLEVRQEGYYPLGYIRIRQA